MIITEARKIKQLMDLIQKTKRCWYWFGGTDKNGYGLTWYRNKNLRVHRVMWSMANRKEIPKGMIVMHVCDTPNCVNPKHLKCGTQKDNMEDKKRKGRCAVGDKNGMRKYPGMLAGEKSGSAKLTKNQVLEIRQKYQIGYTCRGLATLYSISPSQISNIVNRRQWTYVFVQ